jgi:hypothetical protein
MLRREIGALLAGSGVEIQELARELIITSPCYPSGGRVHVAVADGHVLRNGVSGDHREGHQDGTAASGPIGAAMILTALSPPEPNEDPGPGRRVK